MSETYPTTVVVVSDAPGGIQPLLSALESRGFDVRVVDSRTLLDAPHQDRAALAFIDLSCGTQVLEAATDFASQVIAVGNGRSAGDVTHAFRSGFHDFVDRRCDSAELDEVLERALERERSREAFLEYRDHHGKERRMRLTGRTFTVGRDPGNDIVLESAVVSRCHARIEPTAAGHVVLDAGSRHGISVNGVQVKEQILDDGDLIRLGTAGAPVLVFRSAPRSQDTTGGGTGTGPQPASSREMKDIASLLDTFLTLKGDLLLDELLEIVVSRSMELADADRGMILLLSDPGPGDGTGGSEPRDRVPALRPAMARTRDGAPIEETGLALSRRIPEEVIETGRGAILEDLLAPESAAMHSSTIELGLRSAMCVPLRTRNVGGKSTGESDVLGVLYVDSTSRSRPFSPRLLKAFESLAAEAAQAISNARLYRLSLEKRRIDEELHIARSIQRSLLPRRDFDNGWLALRGSSQACHEVGGDLLGYYPIGPDRVGLTVGDVSGKGIPAAILSATLDGICHGLAAHYEAGRDLGQEAGEMNRYLTQKSTGRQFVSLFFGLLLEDGTLTYVNAGHNPPVRIDPSGRTEHLRTGDMILGVFDKTSFRTGHTALGHGDTLLLYSDGITEAPAESGKRFGLERLLKVAIACRQEDPRTLHDRILEEVHRFLGGTAPDDDITLLVAKFR